MAAFRSISGGKVAVHHRPLVVRSCAVCDQGFRAACRSLKRLGCRDLGVVLDLLFFCRCAVILPRGLGSGYLPYSFITILVYRTNLNATNLQEYSIRPS